MLLEIKNLGKDYILAERNKLNTFVSENFDLLYEGAVRLKAKGVKGVEAIPADSYAPRRVQIGRTRLHEYSALKYADGHKKGSWELVTAPQVKQTVADLQQLLDAASEEIACPFEIQIVQR